MGYYEEMADLRHDRALELVRNAKAPRPPAPEPERWQTPADARQGRLPDLPGTEEQR